MRSILEYSRGVGWFQGRGVSPVGENGDPPPPRLEEGIVTVRRNQLMASARLRKRTLGGFFGDVRLGQLLDFEDGTRCRSGASQQAERGDPDTEGSRDQ